MAEVVLDGNVEWRRPSGLRWAEEDGRAMAEALARSGETVAAFAQRHGLKPQRVHTWKRRFAKSVKAVSFVAVRVKGGTSKAAASGSSIELVLRGGHTMRLGHDFDATLLRRVVAALDAEGSC
jgi:hypothetical protein